MAYSFSTILLSAQKTGNPSLIGTTLSGTGVTFLSGNSVVVTTQPVVVQQLNANDIGVTFNPVSVTIGATSLSTFNLTAYPITTVTLDGSIVRIPTAMGPSTLAIVKGPVSNVKTWTVFNYVSSGPTKTIDLTATTSSTDVSDPELRRKWVLGYV